MSDDRKLMAIIDIDDVTLNWTKGFSEFVGYDLTITPKRIHEALNVPPEYENTLIEEFNTSPLFAHLPIIDHAVEAIHTIAKTHSILFVTSCGTSPLTQTLRQENLQRYKLDFQTVFLPIHHPKHEVIASIHPNLLVDDNFDNVTAAQYNNCKSYLFDTPWARRNGKTYTWKDILNENHTFV